MTFSLLLVFFVCAFRAAMAEDKSRTDVRRMLPFGFTISRLASMLTDSTSPTQVMHILVHMYAHVNVCSLLHGPTYVQAARRNRLVRVEVEVDELLVDTLRGQGGLPLAHDVAGEVAD